MYKSLRILSLLIIACVGSAMHAQDQPLVSQPTTALIVPLEDRSDLTKGQIALRSDLGNSVDHAACVRFEVSRRDMSGGAGAACVATDGFRRPPVGQGFFGL